MKMDYIYKKKKKKRTPLNITKEWRTKRNKPSKVHTFEKIKLGRWDESNWEPNYKEKG